MTTANYKDALHALNEAYEAGHAVVHSETLLAVVKSNRRANRAIDYPWLRGAIDPDGLHIVTRALLHNDVDWRCRVYVKVKGDEAPAVVMQDMTMKQWDDLRASTTRLLAKARETVTPA
jgi:hypothetical protein